MNHSDHPAMCVQAEREAKHAADVAEYERRAKLRQAEQVLAQMEELWSGVAVRLPPLVRPVAPTVTLHDILADCPRSIPGLIHPSMEF
jgi:hypothetical protein